MANEGKNSKHIGDSDAKTVATKKGSGGVTASLKVPKGSGSTTGASTATVKRK